MKYPATLLLVIATFVLCIQPTVALGQSNGDADAPRNTTSLTVGYVDDAFALASADSLNLFDYDGSSAALMLSSQSASLMISYGVQDADPERGIRPFRNLAARLDFGGNAHLFRQLAGFPIAAYIPIRVNLGYRNLTQQEEENGSIEPLERLQQAPSADDQESLNVAKGGIGAGVGASIRIPTDLPILEDNLTGFVSVVRSLGGMTDFGDVVDGVRLTQSTDFTVEGKLERLLGNRTGVTIGLTVRSMSWGQETVEEVGDVLDVVTGQDSALRQRSTQTFLRLGINF